MPFDIGFFELALVATVALVVLGPERLPTAARTIGRWVGKARRSFASVKNEINRELQIEELRQQIQQQQEKFEQLANDGQANIEELAKTTQEQIDASRQAFYDDMAKQRIHPESADQPAVEAPGTTEEAPEDTVDEEPTELVEFEPLPRNDESSAEPSPTDNADPSSKDNTTQ